MNLWIATLASAMAVSLVSLLGLFSLSLDEARLRRLATILVSFASAPSSGMRSCT